MHSSINTSKEMTKTAKILFIIYTCVIPVTVWFSVEYFQLRREHKKQTEELKELQMQVPALNQKSVSVMLENAELKGKISEVLLWADAQKKGRTMRDSLVTINTNRYEKVISNINHMPADRLVEFLDSISAN